MTKLEKFKIYMTDICGITVKKELKTIGNYHATEQYLGGVLSGKYDLTDYEEKELYKACNTCRARKLINNDKSQDEN